MPQTIRLTITPDIQKALDVLRQSTMGTLNTTELIKMAVGGYAQDQGGDFDLDANEESEIASQLFYQWAKEDMSLNVSNIKTPEKLKIYNPKKYV